MQRVYKTEVLSGTMSYKSGNGPISTVPYTKSAGRTVLYLNPYIASAVSNFKAPTRFAYEKTLGTGLRGRTYRTDMALQSVTGPVERIGGFQSPLETNGRANTALPLDYSRAYNIALSDLTEKVRGSLDLSIDLFQAGQMVKSADRLLHLTRTFKESFDSIARRKGPLKEIASLYLEWTYGIKPCLDDILTTYDLLVKKGLSGEGLFHFRGRGKYTDSNQFNYFMNIFTYDVNAVAKFTTDLSVRCQLDIYMSPNLSILQKIGNYTSLNPVTWLYEMTPFSFVVDWMFDLGGYLRNLETALLHRDRFVAGCETYSVLERTSLLSNTIVWGVYKFTDGAGDHTFKRYDRYVLPSYPGPKMPRWNPSIGSKRIVNAAALLSQILPNLPLKGRTRFMPAS